MTYENQDNMRATLRAADLHRQFAAWLQADTDRLVASAELLGGQRWKHRAKLVAKEIACGAQPEAVEADLVALHRLLTLELADDIGSPEAVYFLSVHPDDPRADEARLCAEALDRGLAAMRQLAGRSMAEVA